MTAVYLVISYRNPSQVLRLVSALREGPGAEVVVRHDQRTTQLARGDVEERGAHLLEDGIQIEWGELSHVRVLLGALEWALEHLNPDWLLVLSGQDYPLRPMADIEAGLAGSGKDAFLSSAWELPLDRRPEPPDDQFFLRYGYRHYRAPDWVPRAPGALRPVVYTREMPLALGTRVGIRRVRLPFGPDLRCFVSADWLTVSARAAWAITETARGDRALMRYYRRVLIPSESLFATILLNHPDLEVSREGRRFLPFGRPGAPHPDVLTSADLDRLIGSGMDFARKFDVEVDAEVLDALDDRRRSRTVPR
ncbi:MAG: hypothetical protein ACJ8DJ_07965 [Gemmatimonadales bacterium]